MPSFNQAPYLEKSILSVLEQDYPDLELIVVDGGSTDGSVEIIKRHAHRLAWWVSEQDRGQSHAINKGLQRATGTWVGWQNSDDLFCSGGIRAMMTKVLAHPHAGLVVGDMCLIDAEDRIIREMRYVRPTYRSVLAEGMVLTNQSALWRRDLHESSGWLDESLHYGFDFEWFLRLLKMNQAVHVPYLVGCLRLHGQTKTSLCQPGFELEYAQIREGRQSGWLARSLYALRRTVLYAMNGQLTYLAHGVSRRFSGRQY
jgi:glycosyltransferase involved in cell wall biosynthesis